MSISTERQLLIDGIMSMTCPTIRAALKTRKRPVSGVKAVIQKRLLDSLPAENEEDDNVCPICQEDLASVDAKMTTPCGHTFCTGCLLKWGAAGKDSCPCCRAVIPDFGKTSSGGFEYYHANSDTTITSVSELEDLIDSASQVAFRRGKRTGLNQANALADELIDNMSRSHKSEIDKLKSQHLKQLEKIASNCKKFLVTKKELNVAETEKDGALKQWFEERSRREQIELELRIANNRLSQFEELASQITGSVSSPNLSGFNPMNSMITRIR